MRALCFAVVLALVGCAQAPVLRTGPDLQAMRVAIVGGVADEVTVTYQGITIFENKQSQHEVNWGLTSVASLYLKNQLASEGFEQIDDLTADPEFGWPMRDALLSTWTGGKLNPELQGELLALQDRGYEVVIAVRDAPTFLTHESSITGKGVFYRKGFIESSVYGTLAVTPILLEATPTFLSGSHKACPRQIWGSESRLRRFESSVGENKNLSREEVDSVRDDLITMLERSIDASLCYYGFKRYQ